jgi:hypothetical protein
MKYQKEFQSNGIDRSELESEDEPVDHYGHTQQQSSNMYVNQGTVCSRCGALYINGKWTWNTLPDNHEKDLCPACKRIENNEPAGHAILRGTYFAKHKDDIIHFIDNISKSELSDHPLERLMDIKNGSSDTEITTTGIHLARRIGYALQLAYGGELNSTQSDDDHIIVYWTKDS